VNVLNGMSSLVVMLAALTFSPANANQLPSAVITASAAGAKLDSDLLHGGGTDDTAVLQRVLDRAKSGSQVHLIVDGPSLIRGLDVHGRTTIECVGGGGFYLEDGSERAMIRNANRSRSQVLDSNIRIRGCFLNGNRHGQIREGGPFPHPTKACMHVFKVQQERDGTFKSAIQLFGVREVSLEALTVFQSRAFGIWIANAEHVSMRDIKVDSNLPPFPKKATAIEMRAFLDKARTHDDGIHVNGPARFISIEGLEVRTEDDAIGINANDMGVDDMTKHDDMGPFVGQGSIRDVTIRNVALMDSLQGIRLLSSDQRVDRVLIENVHGVVRHRTFIVSHFADRLNSGSRGDFGSIVLRHIDLTLAYFGNWNILYPEFSQYRRPNFWDFDEEGEVPVLSINARIEQLSIEHAYFRAIDDRPFLRIGRDAQVKSLRATATIYDEACKMIPKRLNGGQVERLSVELDWRGASGDCA
jgi:hypothetical protein